MSEFRRILLIWSLLLSTTYAQLNVRSIEKFSVENGLSQNSVHSLYQDSRGLLWIGTEGGINKYDGYEILPYHIFDKQNLFSSRGIIYGITEDKSSNIWYSSMETLSRLSVHSETSQSMRALLKDSSDVSFGTIMNVFQDSNGNIWFGSFGNGLFKVSADFKILKNYRNDPDSTGDSSLDYIRDFYEDAEGNLWLATYGGLVKFNPEKESFSNIFFLQNRAELEHVTVYKLLFDDSKFYLGTNSKGILVYDIRQDSFYDISDEINKKLSRFEVRDLQLDADGKIWIAASEGGVFVIDRGNMKLDRLNDYLSVENQQALIKPRALLIDKSNVLWVGTQFNGLFKIVIGQSFFKTINNKEQNYTGIENNIIQTVSKNENGDLWFSTPSGVYKSNLNNKSLQRLKVSEVSVSSYYSIFNIEFANNSAWISYRNQLIKNEIDSDNYKVVKELPARVNEIASIGSSKLFLGTTNNLGFIYDIDENELTDTINFGADIKWQVTIIESFLDPDSNLWVGTYNDIYKIDLKDSFYKPFRINTPEQAEYITSITLSKNKLWFGTYGAGLFSRDIGSGEINHYTIRDGLPDNIIYGLLTDQQDNLWMTSNRGLIQYDITNNLFKHFTVLDGIQGYEFNSKSFDKSADNTIFYGGINGITFFQPEEIELNKNEPKTLITSVSLFDSTIVANIGSEFNKTFELESSQNSLAFEFTSLDFNDPSKNMYRYKLEGVNENWVSSGNKRYATFANLQPGSYKFSVKGSNNDQLFDQTGASFSFIIHPPFYGTWWFRTLLIVTVLLSLYSIYKIRLMNQERRLREIEGIRRRIADDFHDDLGHKLTRISLYSEMIRNQTEFGKDQRVFLDKISEASNSLFHETKDFIWSIDPEQDTVYDVLVYIKDFGDDFFTRSPVSFIVNEIDENFKNYSLPMKMKRELVLIFKEAMNNVIKHSGASSVELNASVNGSKLIVKLVDDGKGFNLDANESSGRGIGSMKKRAVVVNGKVEIESGESGTAVKFTTNLSGVEK